MHTSLIWLVLCAALATWGHGARAQDPAFLVKDINTRFTLESSDPREFASVGDTVFFSAATLTTGSELWRTDGTDSGTALVKDINPGAGGSFPASIGSLDGTALFFVFSPSGTWELWRSDGTDAGTQLVHDLDGTTVTTSGFARLDGELFFGTAASLPPARLWKTDGTPQGTVPVADLGGLPRSLITVDATLYFRIDGYGHYGQFLWKSDGTTAGTVLVKQFNSGFDISISRHVSAIVNLGARVLLVAGPSNRMELWSSDGTEQGTTIIGTFAGFGGPRPPSLTVAVTVAGEKVLFFAGVTASGIGLWSTDGTEAGTVRITNVGRDREAASEMTALNDRVYFTAADEARGAELWRSDGTAAGTTVVSDINAGPEGSSPRFLTAVDDRLLFTADDGVHGAELWRSDGTAAGTELVEDIAPGATGSSPLDLVALNGVVYFSADDGVHAREPWRSDGTTSGTVLVRNVASDEVASVGSAPTDLVDLNGLLLVRTDDGVHGSELWRSDATADGTVLVKDIHPGPAGSAVDTTVHLWGIIDGSLYFWANDGTHGTELWTSDGTTAGTTLLKDIAPGQADSYAYVLATVDGTTFLSANDPTHGTELWKTDGTTEGTVLVRDLNPGPEGSYPDLMTEVNGALLFRTVRPNSALWRTDGTEAGTVLLKSFSDFFQTSYLTRIGERVVFLSDDDVSGAELWGTDGTADGTTLLADIVPGPGDSFPAEFTEMNGVLFFQAAGGLWKTDGTAAGTALVAQVAVFDDYCRSPFQLTPLNGTLYFRICVGPYATSGTELWRSDGTAAGTMRLEMISIGPVVDQTHAILGDLLLFPGYALDHGIELWSSDGTPAGTGLLKDINPGLAGSYPAFLRAVNGQVIFQACQPDGCTAWVTDGTEQGTQQLAAVPSPGPFEIAGSHVFFSGSDRLTGAELWALPVAAVEPCEDCVPTPTPTATGEPLCVGDCDGDATMTIGELITLVNITLGRAQPSACAQGIRDGAAVDIALLIQAVNNALASCGGPGSTTKVG